MAKAYEFKSTSHEIKDNSNVGSQGSMPLQPLEIWIDIPGYEGLYQASNLGRIKSYDRQEYIVNRWGSLTLRTKKGKIRAQQLCQSNNYYSCTLVNEQGQKRFYVHRLIALTFIPNPEDKEDVNHKDGDKLNNLLSNLEWCTRSENMVHALDNNLSSNAGATHYRAKRVIDTNTGSIYGTIKEAAKGHSIANSTLKAMLSGRKKNITSLKYLEQ